MTDKKINERKKRPFFRKPHPSEAPTREDKRYKGGRMKKSAVILRLLRYLLVHKKMLFLALGLTLLANGLALVGPQLSEYAIDAIEKIFRRT